MIDFIKNRKYIITTTAFADVGKLHVEYVGSVTLDVAKRLCPTLPNINSFFNKKNNTTLVLDDKNYLIFKKEDREYVMMEEWIESAEEPSDAITASIILSSADLSDLTKWLAVRGLADRLIIS